MASEQLIKEELQNGGMAPGVSALSPSHSQMDDDESTGTLERAAQLGVTNGEDAKVDDGEHDQGESEEGEMDEEDAEGDHDDGDFDHDDAEEYESEGAADDADFEEDETLLPHSGRNRGPRVKREDDDEDDEAHDDMEDAEGESDVMEGDEGHDEDAEGESDDDIRHHHHEDDEEGVGAVKIRPGETDDEDDSEASAAASESSGDEWDETAEHAEDDDDDDDEEEEEEEAEEGEEAESGTCFYCKQGEQHDSPKPSKLFFSCLDCSEMAHQECASAHENPAHEDATWKCPNCNGVQLDAAAEGAKMEVDESSQSAHTNGTPSVLTSFKASTPKLSPALRGATANSEPVSEDHTDTGSRSLRKRRTSPIESVDSGMSLRKRRKNAADDLSIDGFSDIRGAAAPSSIRALRTKPPKPSRVTVVKKSRTSLVLKLKVRPKDLRRITVKKRKYTKRGTAVPKIGKREQKRLEKLAAENGISLDSSATPVPIMPSMTAYTQPFYSFFDKETEEQKGKPYGGILNEAEADTSKTFPTPDDRRRFDEAKQKAEDEWRARLLTMQSEAEAQQQQLQPAARRKKSTAGPASQIECIEFGGWEIDTWYAAPYPEEYSRNRVLYICEFCLKYMNSDYVAWRHKLKCPAKHPPGDEIYRHKSISFFEVDGRKNPVYCQNLCLLAKLFLGSKTLYYDVEPFLFYVLCEYDEFGYHFVGYFSKEKRASSQNNVSCILTLPIHQRKGYGNLLIDFSYLLTRVEEKTGSPEKPLSDMGLVSYRNYWRLVMCQYLLRAMKEASDNNSKLGLSIKKISDDTGMTADDVISALEGLRCLVRDPQTELYAFRVDVAYCQEYVAKWEAKKYVTLNEEALTWTPYVMGRGNATNFELGPALTAIAPREEDDENEDEGAAAHGAGEPKPKPGRTNGDGAEHTNGITPADPGADADADADADGEPDPSSVAHNSEAASGSGVSKPQTSEDTEMADREAGKNSTDPALQPVNGNAGPAGTHSDGVKKEEHVASSSNGQSHGHAHGTSTGDADNDSDWASAYDSIPTTRFAVFPAVSGRRLNNYPRGAIGRPPGARTGATGTRSRRYATSNSTSHVRRSVGATASPGRAGATPKSTRPKTATSASKKKKAGGTGRGPGRWPKGTKKSDYGNADSGPGLPPAWLAVQSTPKEEAESEQEADAGADASADAEGERGIEVGVANDAVDDDYDDSKDAEGEVDPDTVQVHTPASSRLGDKRNGLNGAVLESGSRGRSSPRLGKIKSAQKLPRDSDDTVMVDANE